MVFVVTGINGTIRTNTRLAYADDIAVTTRILKSLYEVVATGKVSLYKQENLAAQKLVDTSIYLQNRLMYRSIVP